MSMEDIIIGSLKEIYGFVRFIVYLPRSLKSVFDIPDRESFYPEYERKSRKKIIRENLSYLFKYREVNPYYISYGFDVENFRDQDEFIAHRTFITDRLRKNQIPKRTHTGDYNYIVLLRDKYIFANYLNSVFRSNAAIPTVALIADGKAFYHEDGKWHSIEELFAENGKKVFKVLDGECADGVMLTEVKDNVLYVDGQQRNKEDYISYLQDKKVIVQYVVEQHDALKQFKTKGVNTVRIVTVKGKSGNVGILSAFLRLSADKESFVDNRAKGGLAVGISLETGRLDKYGYPHDGFGKRTEIHRLSGIVFEGYQLPEWEAVKKLVIEAHKQFYEIQSIGWDVIITPEGPKLLEGNDDWEIGGPQDTSGGLKRRWNDLVNG